MAAVCAKDKVWLTPMKEAVLLQRHIGIQMKKCCWSPPWQIDLQMYCIYVHKFVTLKGARFYKAASPELFILIAFPKSINQLFKQGSIKFFSFTDIFDRQFFTHRRNGGLHLYSVRGVRLLTSQYSWIPQRQFPLNKLLLPKSNPATGGLP